MDEETLAAKRSRVLADLPTGELLNDLRALDRLDLGPAGHAYFWDAARLLVSRHPKVRSAINWWASDDRTDSVVDRITEALPGEGDSAAMLERLHDLDLTNGELRWLAEYLTDSADMGPALDALARGRMGDPSWSLIADDEDGRR